MGATKARSRRAQLLCPGITAGGSRTDRSVPTNDSDLRYDVTPVLCDDTAECHNGSRHREQCNLRFFAYDSRRGYRRRRRPGNCGYTVMRNSVERDDNFDKNL